MELIIPVDTLAEHANLNQLANVIRTIDGDHTASAADIADGIADSGYFHDLTRRIAEQVQTATAVSIAEQLRDRGFDALAEQIIDGYTPQTLELLLAGHR